MAHFKSVVTTAGAQLLSSVLANGGNLVLTRAAAGSGVPDADRQGRAILSPRKQACPSQWGIRSYHPATPL